MVVLGSESIVSYPFVNEGLMESQGKIHGCEVGGDCVSLYYYESVAVFFQVGNFI